MELDDFKNKVQAGKEFAAGDRSESISSLVEELKKADAEVKKKIWVFAIIMLGFCVIYLSILTSQRQEIREGYFLLVTGFLIILLYHLISLYRLRKIDYSAPTLVFLKRAKQRYSFMKPADWLVLIVFLGTGGYGGGIIVWYSFAKYFSDPTPALVIYIFILCMAVGIGFWSSRRDWKKTKGDLTSKIGKLILEIEKNQVV